MTYEEMEAVAESIGRVHRGFTHSDIDKIKWLTYMRQGQEEVSCTICI
jgi:hypothetical protein